MPRTKSVLLRLTEEEYARLKELAGREPMNAYLRRMALGEEPAIPDHGPLDPDSWVSKGLRKQEPPEVTSRVTNIPTKPHARCTVKGCTFTSSKYPDRCPKHGFSTVELT